MGLRQQQEYIERRRDAKRELEENKERYEILNTAKKGQLETGKRAVTTDEIDRYIDLETKGKAYRLQMEKGPYKVRYTPSGGHVMYIGSTEAKIVDVIKMNARMEIDLNDQIYDGCFLHSDKYFALAQSKSVYIYDKDGVELHVLREHKNVKKIQFLQDHFLLCTLSERGMLRYQDTTIGKMVSEIKTKERGNVLAQDKTNGVVYVAGSNGHISLWAPRSPEYLAKILCHRVGVQHMKVSDSGAYLYTSSGSELHKWDIRNMFAPLEKKNFSGNIYAFDVSQTGVLAVTQRKEVSVYNSKGKEILKHYLGRDRPHSLAFTPYEDTLTIGTDTGAETIVVPGSGADKYMPGENPYVSKERRQNIEIKRILEKIPADMISLENEVATEIRNDFVEEITPMKDETPENKVRRLMRIHYS